MGLPVTVGGTVTAADINDISGLPVANFAALPASGNWLGRLIATSDSGITYRWSGSAWVEAGEPFCVLRKSADQNLTVAAAALTWDVQIKNDSAMHSTSVNNTRMIAPIAGTYQVDVNIYNGNASGVGLVFGRLNSATAVTGSTDRATGAAGVGIPFKYGFTVVMAVDDYVEIMVSHATAVGNIAGGTGDLAAVVTMRRIGA